MGRQQCERGGEDARVASDSRGSGEARRPESIDDLRAHDGGHVPAIRNKAEAAYRRGTLIEKRRQLMEAWAAYLMPTLGTTVPDPVTPGGRRC